MANVAILIGNSNYAKLPPLSCCSADVAAMKELLEVTGKYQPIEVALDQDSTQLKASVRMFMDAHKGADEIFFYFSGHGLYSDSDFFFCATDFDDRHPNQTGLSHTELLEFLRMADASLVVKVIDACNSGSPLIKSDAPFSRQSKYGLRNLIQIASCLDSQNALTGDPISEFTANFRAAALQKKEGIVWYTDIIDTLRDEYLGNTTQIPHFVSQGTGRDQFVDDAKRFDELRARLVSATRAEPSIEEMPERAAPSAVEILRQGADQFASRELAQNLISGLFDEIVRDWPGEFSDYYTAKSVEHSDYTEGNSKAFIIRLMKQEKRADNFVTVETTREKRRVSQIDRMLNPFPFGRSDEDYVEHNDLILRCALDKVQLKITFTPVFQTLRQIVLVVSCLPSLPKCFITEIITAHPLSSWSEYDYQGQELVRQWRTIGWTESPNGIAKLIREKLLSTIQGQIDAAVKALESNDKGQAS